MIISSVIDSATRPHQIQNFDRETRRRRALEIIREKESVFWNLLDQVEVPDQLYDHLMRPSPETLDHLTNNLSEDFFKRMESRRNSHPVGDENIWDSVVRPWIETESIIDRSRLVLLLAELAGLLTTEHSEDQENRLKRIDGNSTIQKSDRQIFLITDSTMSQLLDFVSDCRDLTQHLESRPLLDVSFGKSFQFCDHIDKPSHHFEQQAFNVCHLHPEYDAVNLDIQQL